MISIIQLTENLKSYINTQVDNMSLNNPMIAFIKPLISRAIDKNFSKVNKALDFIADSEGNIDIENILSEMMSSVVNTKPFVFSTSIIGDIEIGGGTIKLNVPLTNKKLVLDMSDLENFKEMITNKK